jgi:hypothetical protein
MNWLGRVAVRALEGPHRWGWSDIRPSNRSGWLTVRVAVYPPGTNAAERRILTFARNWPWLSAAIILLTILMLGADMRPVIFVPVAAGAYAGSIVLVMRRTRRLRRHVRYIAGAQFMADDTAQSIGGFSKHAKPPHEQLTRVR